MEGKKGKREGGKEGEREGRREGGKRKWKASLYVTCKHSKILFIYPFAIRKSLRIKSGLLCSCEDQIPK